MEPLLIVLVPGLLGGALVALVLFRIARVPSQLVTMAERLEPPSTGMINMAHIKVAGTGGLGMVAMSIVVAIFVPRIRFTMALAFLLGCAMAAILVAIRRRSGDSPAGIDPGAHALLPFEAPVSIRGADSRDSNARGSTSVAIPGVAVPAAGLAI